MASCVLLPSLSGSEGCHGAVPHVLLLGPGMEKRWSQARSTLQSSLLLGRLCFSHSMFVNITVL